MLDVLRSLPAYQHLIGNLKAGTPVSGLALPRAARLPVVASLFNDLDRPILLITDRTDRALTILDELGFWTAEGNKRLFPEPNPLFYEQATWGTATRRDRLQVLTGLVSYHMPGVNQAASYPLIVASIRAIMTRTLPRRDFIKESRFQKLGQSVSPESLQRHWIEIGYQPADIVVESGQFSRRGGLLDVWPPAENYPVRLEFFGDEIDTIRQFDPASQRTIQKLEQVLITPAREILPGRVAEPDLPLGEIEEFYLPKAHPAVASLMDYLPRQSLVVLDDIDLIQTTASEIEDQSVRLRQESIAEGTLPADFPIPYLSWSEIQDNLSGHAWIEMGRSTSIDETSELAESLLAGPRFGGHLKQFMDYLFDHCQVGDRMVVVSRQVPRLHELWSERASHNDLPSNPEFIEGTLSEGWTLCLAGKCTFYLLTDSEIFGWERPKPRKPYHPSAETPEASFADLRPGDWVVHVDYGIGRFVGLVQRELDGSSREFLCVEYEKGDQLFVPVHQADRLSRFIGPDGETPSPTRLGTPEWSSAKQRVREAVIEVAQELLDLYAKRQVAIGNSFSKDNPWQRELEASFPYIETEDQLRAIEEVKRDMEADRPMDRLLCGDVGYGKTEVALRAAFKAVNDGKQVAVLVPTTVLAQQHYDTFCQRLAPFPVEVEMLSRFRPPKEQDQIIKRLGTGSVDIVIGTHRLIQPDVQFKDLGLVVIDEEQRFGVTHKEYLKRLRTEVDVLTLTATPIPRTLYMALTGVRDISTINSPPEERLPIITHIGPYSPRLVRQAILRELERGGQVFFVHNRVQTIRSMESHLNRLVPEARVGIAHGQMPENELADMMHRFTHAEIDVLLCTSIIESGLDIPNANTLIVDRGDTFGLAQLYQLRGRVGRGAQRAYAYFFRHRRRLPTPEGEERLEIIAENTQLGSGYSIAMRDLEMRGAGELLGMRQHGYIAAVGFQLYTRLLAQSVNNLRKAAGLSVPSDKLIEAGELLIPVNVDLPFSIGIPIDYIPDQNMRIRLYRRLANLKSNGEVDAIMDELIDRFGALPESVSNMIYQIRVKLLADLAGLASVTAEGDQIVLRYPPLPEGVNSRNLDPIGFQSRIGKNAYWMQFGEDETDWKERLVNMLSVLAESKTLA